MGYGKGNNLFNLSSRIMPANQCLLQWAQGQGQLSQAHLELPKAFRGALEKEEQGEAPLAQTWAATEHLHYFL